MTINLITYQIASFVTTPQIDTDDLWKISFFFMGLATVYFVSVFIFRNRISSKSSLTKLRKNELSPMISEFLFYDDEGDKSEKSQYIELKIAIRELLKDDFNRRLLTEILLDLRKDVSGDTQRRLFKLYQDLGLEKDAFSKLKSWRWEVISKGIFELTLMQVEDAFGFIVKFINDRRATIRKQAEIATVTLKPGGIDYFLDTTKYKISEWQQLKLLDVLRNKEGFEPPRFKAWLTSTNKHVVLFSLRLIKHYRQNDANAAVVELIKHRDSQVRRQAIDCITEFHVVEALPILKGVFKKSSVETKICILGAIAELGTSHEIEFLESVSLSEGNFSVKSKAVGAINTINPGSIMPTEGLEYVKPYQVSEEPDKKLQSIKDDASVTESVSTAKLEKDTKETPEQIIDRQHDTPTDCKFVADTDQESKTNLDSNTNSASTENNETMASQKQPDQSLRDIEFEYEEIVPITSGRTVEDTLENPEEVSNKMLPINGLTQYKDSKETQNNTTDQEDTSTQDSSSNLDDISDIHFLPVVIADPNNNISEPESAMGNSDIDAHETKKNQAEADSDNLKDIQVNSVEIVSETLDEELEALVAEIKEIAFLPFVTDEISPIVTSNSSDDDEAANTHEIIEEQFIGEKSDTKRSKMADEVNSVEKETESLEKIEGFSLSDFEISFKQKSNDPLAGEEETLHFELNDEPIVDVENPQVEDVLSSLLADSELRNIECKYDTVHRASDDQRMEKLIPEPVYYDEHEAYMMALLDDLEELGDHREIPLLEELKIEESKSFIKDRIDLMIQKFKIQQRAKTTKSTEPQREPILLPVFSVFADLFKSIDKESKLILLDEVVTVGDEKEIEFLNSLLDDQDKEISIKAQAVLKELIAKLSHQNPSATYSKGVSDILAEQITNDEALSEKIYDSLLSELGLISSESEIDSADTSQDEVKVSHLNSSSNQTDLESDSMSESPNKTPKKVGEFYRDKDLFNPDFQICELLDKTSSPEILNLPVISTEISPHENEGSFFSIMRNITKLFF